MSSPETCPNCGAAVPRNASACPECGSCEETGWSTEAQSGSLGLPEEDFDYSDYVKREFGGRKTAPRGISRFWWVIAILVLALIIAAILR
jgi:hypothetical protein